MRVLIMTDMEGVSGIVTWSQVNGGKPMYEEGRRLYTEEINAAVRGAKAAGATEIVVGFAGTYGSTAVRSDRAFFAPCSIICLARTGGIWRAE